MVSDLKARTVDDHRRVVLPESCPAGSTVIVQQLDEDTYIVRRQRPRQHLFVVLERDVEKLRDDPDMDALGEKASKAGLKKLPKFDEL
ncbi:MAG TPA: hypothetical protein VMF08_02905 [Candidatus Sulfotelmatobacter sp.]|nr:hypothetical protein [Candidatus Sulfotelmatobacter sp.]